MHVSELSLTDIITDTMHAYAGFKVHAHLQSHTTIFPQLLINVMSSSGFVNMSVVLYVKYSTHPAEPRQP